MDDVINWKGIEKRTIIRKTDSTAACSMTTVLEVYDDVENGVPHIGCWLTNWMRILLKLVSQMYQTMRPTDQSLRSRTMTYIAPVGYFWQPPSDVRLYSVRPGATKLLIKKLLKVITITIKVKIILTIPTVAALSEFDLRKVGPSVYGQLAQGVVVACFAVLLTRVPQQRPIDTLANGPLSSLSSAYWMWMNRGVKAVSEPQVIGVSYSEDIDPKLALKKHTLAALPGIVITLSSFIVYLSYSLDGRIRWQWAITISITGILSEVSRLLATWLAIISMKTKPVDMIFTEFFESQPRMFLPRYEGMSYRRPFIRWRPNSILRPLWKFTEFSNSKNSVRGSFHGDFSFIWYWKHHDTALTSLLLFCIAAIFLLLSAGALIASGDTSVVAASLGVLLCLSAGGFFRVVASKEQLLLDEFEEYSSATRLTQVISSTIEHFSPYSLLVDIETFVLKSVLSDSRTIVMEDKVLQTFKIELASKINMHEVLYYYTGTEPVSRRMMDWRDGDTKRSTLLEIADALYCRALLIIKHAHTCAHGQHRLLESKCNVNASNLMSAVLLASGHTECRDVLDILSGILDWMNNDDLLWSIIGSNVTLDMMILSHLREQLELSSSTRDLALRICHMAIYEKCPQGGMLEAVPTALYCLLTGRTALGHAMARIVENAIYCFGATDMTLALDQVTIRVNEYEVVCQGKLHDWPGGHIPVVDSSVNTYQPRYYSLAKAIFEPKLQEFYMNEHQSS